MDWPENLIIWGAGATAALGMPTSEEQSNFISAVRDQKDLSYFLGQTKYNTPDSLFQFLQMVPRENKISIQDTLNLLAVCRQQKRTFNPNGKIFSPKLLQECSQQLSQLMTCFFQNRYKVLLESKTKVLQQYYDVYRILAEYELGNKIKNASAQNLLKREWYLLDYAFVNFNWDILILWIIFNVHREMNNENSFFFGVSATKLKVFNDFSSFMGAYPLENGSGIWYPYNETVLQRVNDPEHISDRRLLLGKFYQLHGSFNWKECPHCGKLNMWLGEKWELCSETLFAAEKLNKCLFCENQLDDDSVRLLQTPFKDANPPYIEEIQRDMLVGIENAEHLIFAGYSLPEDDLFYRSIFAARRSKKQDLRITVLLKDDQCNVERWYKRSEVQNATVERIAQILGVSDENIRVNFDGIPNVFLTEGRADRNKIIETFYWEK